jgi:hypothetical protein
MIKRSVVWIVFFVIIALGVYFFLSSGGGSGLGLNETILVNDTILSEAQECSDYKNQGDCTLDVFGFKNCLWDVNASDCEAKVEAHEPEPVPQVLDIEAISLNVTSLGCSVVTNSTTNVTSHECDLNLKGVLKNVGTGAINESFIVQFFEVTNSGTSLIDLIKVDSLGFESQKEISVKYEGIPPGKYFIRFRVDGVNDLDEANEDNNFVTEVIDVS